MTGLILKLGGGVLSEDFLRIRFEGLIFCGGGGILSEFYGIWQVTSQTYQIYEECTQTAVICLSVLGNIIGHSVLE